LPRRPIMILSQHDWRDQTAASGIPHNVATAAAQIRDDVICFGPLTGGVAGYPRQLTESLLRKAGRPASYLRAGQSLLNKSYARQALTAIAVHRPRAVLALGISAIAYLKSDIPVFLWTGESEQLLRPPESRNKRLVRRELRRLEECRRALRNSRGQIAATSGTRAAMVEKFGVPLESCILSPWGIWAPRAPVSRLNIESRLATIRLLAVGRPCLEEAVPQAIALAQELNDSGLPATLDLVGAQPRDERTLPPFVRLYERPDRLGYAEVPILDNLFRRSTFFLALDDNDDNAQVSRAASYGLPCVPAIPSAAKKISEAANPSTYVPLCESLQEEFYASLSWPATVGRVLDFVDELG
jgi:hypothetical protein